MSAATVSELSHKVDELKLEMKELNADCERRLEESESMHSEQLDTKNELIEKHISDKESLQQQKEEQIKKLESLNQKINSMTELISQMEASKELIEQELAVLKTSNADLNKEVSSFKTQMETSGKNESELTETLNQLSQELKASQSSNESLLKGKQGKEEELVVLTQEFN